MNLNIENSLPPQVGPTAEERAAVAAKITEAFPEMAGILAFNEQFDDTPKTLAKVTKRYEDPITLSELLTSLIPLHERTIWWNFDPKYTTPEQTKFVFRQLAITLDHVASIVEQLKCRTLIPVNCDRLRVSASNYRRLANLYLPDPEQMNTELCLLQEELVTSGGFPFLTDVLHMATFVCHASDERILWGDQFQIDESAHIIRRSGNRDQHARAEFSLCRTHEPWDFAVALLEAAGEPVDFQKSKMVEQSKGNLRQIAKSVRDQFKNLGVRVDNVATSTWKAVVEDRE